MSPHIWTDEMNLAFTRMHRHKDDYSFEVMAAKMSALFDIKLTRNALIGKARRLGLPMRGQQKLARLPIEKKIRMRKHKVDAPIAPVEAVRPAEAGALTIYQLQYGDCRWPLGEVTDYPPYLYCGKPALFDRPYCKNCSIRAYNRVVA